MRAIREMRDLIGVSVDGILGVNVLESPDAGLLFEKLRIGSVVLRLGAIQDERCCPWPKVARCGDWGMTGELRTSY